MRHCSAPEKPLPAATLEAYLQALHEAARAGKLTWAEHDKQTAELWGRLRVARGRSSPVQLDPATAARVDVAIRRSVEVTR